jgi:dTDP-4-amino-4,6-dideoxygalactose transaminase
VRISPDSPVERTELMRRLLHDGVPTRRGVMACHEEASYAKQAPRLPYTEAAAREVMMLPLYADLSTEHQDYVIERLVARLGSVGCAAAPSGRVCA